jgi:predicted  nucleic acid-binding Zn-ribbon protein
MTLQEVEQALTIHQGRMDRIDAKLERLTEFAEVQGAAWVRLENRMEDLAARHDEDWNRIVDAMNRHEVRLAKVEDQMPEIRAALFELTKNVDNFLKGLSKGDGHSPA